MGIFKPLICLSQIFSLWDSGRKEQWGKGELGVSQPPVLALAPSLPLTQPNISARFSVVLLKV